MSKVIPQISKYMTAMPHTIGVEQSLKVAKDLMQKHGIRHLPVKSGGKLVGLVTERDINLLASFAEVDFSHSTVKDAMSTDLFEVEPDTTVDLVAAEMAEKRIGSALIVQSNGTLVGIFTAIDALQCLAHEFAGRLKK